MTMRTYIACDARCSAWVVSAIELEACSKRSPCSSTWRREAEAAEEAAPRHTRGRGSTASNRELARHP
jgi:hypothetical protein